MELTYLGQAGFLIEDHESRYLIDPYLSNYVVTGGIGDPKYFSRVFPPPVKAEDLRDISAVFVTHDHADHCDPDTILPILANNPGCKIIGPQPALTLLAQRGVGTSQLLLAPIADWMEFGSIRFTALPSAHYELERDEYSGNYPYLGFVIEMDGKILYHSGDTIFYEGMLDRLKMISDHYDVCCLPVNGRDTQREALGIIGNLQPEEALWLTDQLKAEMLIPTHNDPSEINHLDPSRLEEHKKIHYPGQGVKWMEPGGFFSL